METIDIGPVKVARLTFASALQHIRNSMASGEQTRVAFCNAHTASLAFRDKDYCRILSRMLVLNDGVGLNIASRLLEGRRFPENLNGTDFVPRLLAELPGPLRIFLLGATDEVVRGASREWATRFQPHVIFGYRHGFFDLERDGHDVVATINAARPDVLLVGMGNPRQEIFMDRYAKHLDCALIIGVGALFDFGSGAVPRAPAWVQKMGLEWLFRLKTEPRRLWKRYTVETAGFLLTILALRMRRRRHQPRTGQSQR